MNQSNFLNSLKKEKKTRLKFLNGKHAVVIKFWQVKLCYLLHLEARHLCLM